MYIHRNTVYQLGGVLAVWCMVFLLRLVPLGGDWHPVSTGTYGFLLSWQMLYSISWILGACLWKTRKPEYRCSSAFDEQLVARFAVLAALGAVLMAIEFAIVRGYGFSTPVADIRIMEVEAVSSGRGGAMLSGIGRLLMPALFVAWIVFRQSVQDFGRMTRSVLYASTAFVLWAQSAFEGGRFFLVVLVLAIWFARRGGQKVVERNWSGLLFVSALAVFLFSGYVFLDRFSSSDLGFSTIYENFASSFNIDLSSAVHDRLSGSFAALWFALTMLWVYLTHAVSELDVLLAQSNSVYALGGYQFPQIVQGLRIVFDWQPEFGVFGLENPGVYLTLPGGGYVDFGYLGSYLAAAVLGCLTGIALEEKNRIGVGRLASSAPLLLVVAIFVPVHSILTTIWPAVVYAWLFCCCKRGA